MNTKDHLRTPRTPANAESQPRIFGSAIFRAIDGAFTRATGALGRHVPDHLNPLARLGALANLMLVIACISGALLLFWYVPSLDSAWQSVEEMALSPLLAGLMRSVHRYSSDAAMLLVLLHGLQMLAQRRLAGPRWVAWVTGIAGFGFLWFVGWLGYWLVWDMRGQAVATGTAKMLDALPIFVDPVSASFLTDASVPSLLFFVVFFLHILLPLILVISLWLHLARLSRSNWMTQRGLTWLALGTLVVLSLIAPATSAPKAAMTVHPDGITVDAWYLLPTLVTERLGGGALWALSLGLGLALVAMPWWFVKKTHHRPPDAAEPPTQARRAPVATVDAGKCNACETCWKDCPFDAIAMMPRTDGRRFRSVAVVDPDRCVGCGICSGSCDSSAIGLPWLTQPSVRQRFDVWKMGAPNDTAARSLDIQPSVEAQPALESVATGDIVVFACARSAARDLSVDATTGQAAELPGTRVIAMPCAGWLHALTVERALKRGAAGVVVVSCTPANCASREGAATARERLESDREPALDPKRVDLKRFRRIEADAHDKARLLTALSDFRAGRADAPTSPSKTRRWFVAGLAMVGLTALTWLPSDMPWPSFVPDEPELVVAFKFAGDIVEACVERTPAELAALPPHKRIARVCERQRRGVKLAIAIDGVPVLARAYAAGGLFGDGATRAVERLTVAPGDHDIAVTLSVEGTTTSHTGSWSRTFTPARRNVVVFDAAHGFFVH